MAVETVAETRLRNLKFLFERFKDEVRESWPNEPDRGMLKRFAEKLGVSPIYLSQVMNGHKDIGTYTRKNIEAALNLQTGWLDSDHSQDDLQSDDSAKAFQDSVMAIYWQNPEASRDALLKIFGQLATGKPLEDLIKKHANGKAAGRK